MLVDDEEFRDNFLVSGAFLDDISDDDLDRVFFLYIHIGKCIQDATRVLQTLREKEEQILYCLNTASCEPLDIAICCVEERLS